MQQLNVALASASAKELAAANYATATKQPWSEAQLNVWTACYLIPKGRVATYGTLSSSAQLAPG